MPPRADRARFTDVGSVESLGGLPLHVRVSGDAVIVAGHYLNAAQRETFAALFVRACWAAARDRSP
jgi:uncharacterized membrane protein